jgi:hypothetical protein
MLSTSQTIVVLLALLAAIITVIGFSYMKRVRFHNSRALHMIYPASLLFLAFTALEIVYFRYLTSFIFDSGWNAVLLVNLIFLLISLPLLRLTPKKVILTFLKPSPQQIPVTTFPVTQVAEPIGEIKEEVEVIEAEIHPEVQREPEIQTEQVIAATPETDIPVEDIEADKVIETAVEKKPVHSKKTPVRKTAKPKAQQKAQTKKPAVHKTKKKST